MILDTGILGYNVALFKKKNQLLYSKRIFNYYLIWFFQVPKSAVSWNNELIHCTEEKNDPESAEKMINKHVEHFCFMSYKSQRDRKTTSYITNSVEIRESNNPREEIKRD